MRVLAVKRISPDAESSSALERQGLELSEAIAGSEHGREGLRKASTALREHDSAMHFKGNRSQR